MNKHLLALMVCGFAMTIGTSVALAGGTSDTSGDGFHCYQFFTLPGGQFAQAMTNDSDSSVVVEKLTEFLDKYVVAEGGTLTAAAGNVDECVLTCEEQCEIDAKNVFDDCIASGENPVVCQLKASAALNECLPRCVELPPECGPGESQGCGVGACTGGSQVCEEGVFGECSTAGQASPEVCDGIDNNCDGLVDEACVEECAAGDTRECSRQNVNGECFGTEICDPILGFGMCTAQEPTPEVCDGLDNDCDGIVDNDIFAVGGPCDGDDSDFCSDGTLVCSGQGGLFCNDPGDIQEICGNLIDDDCDRDVDEVDCIP